MQRILTPDFQTMLDVFAASDGGAKLCTFHANYDELVERAANGDEAAAELVLIFSRAARLVDMLSQQK